MEIELNPSNSAASKVSRKESLSNEESLLNASTNQTDLKQCSEAFDPFAEIIEQLASNDRVFCKSQQRDESDISKDEKTKILKTIFEKSKSNFLSRFGQFLSSEQVQMFNQFQNSSEDGYEVMFHLKSISQMHSTKKRHRYLRNKRYAALKRLVEKDTYFSETEMMKRNPLLYEQLVGQYLSAKEKKLRDYDNSCVKTFVGLLMKGIENEQTEIKRKQQEEAEDAIMEKSNSSDDSSSEDETAEPKPSSSVKKTREKPVLTLWGEIQEGAPKKIKSTPLSISAEERRLLRQEFVSSMYQSFLDGEDDDFDYSTVDNNEEYDNLEILTYDEEEKYFDSEEPEDMTMEDDIAANKPNEDSSEDELDIYMNALNQHPVVCQLSEDMKKL